MERSSIFSHLAHDSKHLTLDITADHFAGFAGAYDVQIRMTREKKNVMTNTVPNHRGMGSPCCTTRGVLSASGWSVDVSTGGGPAT